MSLRGVGGGCSGSGDAVASGVGSVGTGGVTEDLLVFLGAALFRFRGDVAFTGEAGSLGGAVSSGSNICGGSIPSPVLNLRDLADFLGDVFALAIVCRRVDFRGLRDGAGVNSSSLSSATRLSSSSDSSTMIVLRVARRVGRTGVSSDILRLPGRAGKW